MKLFAHNEMRSIIWEIDTSLNVRRHGGRYLYLSFSLHSYLDGDYSDKELQNLKKLYSKLLALEDKECKFLMSKP